MTTMSAVRARSGIRADHRVARLIERLALGLAIGAQLALRLLYVLHHRADSDEPQHLHVAWGWTQGAVQYRDVFDNHVPLFHLMMAPLLRVLGERADIIDLMRLPMLLLAAATLWATYRLGAELWSERVGLWAAALTGLAPGFLLTTVEFRTDVLWTAAWLAALLVLTTGRLTPRRGLLGGLLLGIMVATTLKSILLLAALALSGAIVMLLNRRPPTAREPRRPMRAVAWAAAGLLVVPGVLVAVFWRLDALAAFRYCTMTHNVVPGLGLWHTAPYRQFIVPVALLVLIPAAHGLLRSSPDEPRTRHRVLLLMTAGLYIALLEGTWPLLTAQDYLPFTPLAVLLAVAAVHEIVSRIATRLRIRALPIGLTAALALVALIQVVSVSRAEPAWRDHDQPQTQLLRDVLRLTRRGEPIMDLKGETVFRPRPYYFVLEGVTKARIANGSLPDRIEADVVRTRTHFAALDDEGFPPAGRQFLIHHFVPAGMLRVLGSDLGDGLDSESTPRRFDVSFPERFAVIADGAAARGRLDGETVAGPRWLDAGPHEYRPAPGESHVVVLWATVLARDPGVASASGASR